MVIEHDLKVEDRVQLAGGSPTMIVERIDGNMIVCAFGHVKYGEQKHRLYADQLVKNENTR